MSAKTVEWGVHFSVDDPAFEAGIWLFSSEEEAQGVVDRSPATRILCTRTHVVSEWAEVSA